TVTVNGKPHDYADGATVADVILDITGHAHDDDQLGVAVALDAAV
ncbi:MAG TPA: thiamine biosynthesis protein ThiS, partial [Corynebacterium variabile]|nr:thiamine biosynthesis protein ThiS [Corynebacterium variabile]